MTEFNPLEEYRRVNLISDPMYGYLRLTKPDREGPEEVTEQELVDHRWVQRMRRIHQLQSAWWVFPTAEHTRFQHVLGAMHLAGEMGRRLYPSLRAAHPEVPSSHLVEELLRVAGLLHDIGHGPFGHFFDDEYLAGFELTHEVISQRLITGELAPLIAGLRRSPFGPFEPGEAIDPRHVALLIRNQGADDGPVPGWLEPLRAVFCSLYTADNMDYVRRDSYYSGVSTGPVDVPRIVHYSFVDRRGLVLHKHGEAAAFMFLNARMYLYNNLYFHRTVRAIDLHLREIFQPTLELMGIGDPGADLERYRDLTEWSLIQQAEGWARGEDGPEREALGREWQAIVERRLRWRMNYEGMLVFDELAPGTRFTTGAEYEELVREALPPGLRGIDFRVDLASLDHRSLNPLTDESAVVVYDPNTDTTETLRSRQVLARMPVRTTLFRVFATSHAHQVELVRAATAALRSAGTPSITTNV